MSKYKKRMLVLTPRFPYPVIGGDRLRIYQVCKALSKRYSLTLLSLCESKKELEFSMPDDGVYDRVERVLLRRFQSYVNSLISLPTNTPIQTAYYRSHSFADAVKRLLPEHDIVLSHLIRCAEYVRYYKIPKILEMTDAISLNYIRVKNNANYGGLKGLVYRIESNRLLEYERNVVNDFDLSVLVSSNDKKFLLGYEQTVGDKVLVCSNGVELSDYPFAIRNVSQPVIVFIGNMFSVQNMDACLYFAADVMPVITAELSAKFRVVGKISKSNSERLQKYPNIEITGEVSTISDAVTDARVAVCPMRIGAGVQNKVLEYMALGIPTITSSVGLEGLDAVPEKDILLADTPDEYLSQIKRIWSDKSLFQNLAQNARAYIEINHNWDAQLTPLIDRVDCIMKI